MGSNRSAGAQDPPNRSAYNANHSSSDYSSNASVKNNSKAEVGTSRAVASTSILRGAVAVSSSSPTSASALLNRGRVSHLDFLLTWMGERFSINLPLVFSL
jgi:hypothetical protein